MLTDIKRWLYRRMALNNMTAGNPEKAEKWYKKLELLEPDSLEVIHNLGVIYVSLKRFPDAESYLSREIGQFGESEIRCRILGDLYFVSGDRKRAERYYGRALALLQDGSGDKSTAKFLRRRLKQCEEKSTYETALEGLKHYENGLTHYASGEYKEALDSYNRAMKCDNSSFMAMNAAGTLLMNNIRDYEQARNFFRKALDLADMPVIRQNLALAEYKIKTGGDKK